LVTSPKNIQGLNYLAGTNLLPENASRKVWLQKEIVREMKKTVTGEIFSYSDPCNFLLAIEGVQYFLSFSTSKVIIKDS
jgi:hypothetical protein